MNGWRFPIAAVVMLILASHDFALSSPPQTQPSAESTKDKPPLGGNGVAEHIRQLIAADAPALPAATTAPIVAWSEPVGGLQGGIVYAAQGKYCGPNVDVLVGFRNVTDSPVTLPAGRLFELQTRTGSSAWVPTEGFPLNEIQKTALLSGCFFHPNDADTEPNNKDNMAGLTLAPGKEAIIYVGGEGDASLKRCSEIRIILRHAKSAGSGWEGVLETPPAPRPLTLWTEDMNSKLKGPLPFSDSFPALNPVGFLGPSRSMMESRVEELEISNCVLLAALELFEPDGVRKEFEHRMDVVKDPAMKILLAEVAAGVGSQKAALYLLNAMDETDYYAVKNVHRALYSLVNHPNRDMPDWLLAMVEAALSDEHEVTGATIWGPNAHYTISHCAEEEGGLTRALGFAKCRAAVPFLEEMIRKNNSCGAIETLGAIGDNRAVPVLLEVLKESAKDAFPKVGTWNPETSTLQERFFRSAEALAALKASEAVPILLERLEWPDIIQDLELIGDSNALPALRKLVQDEGKIIRDGQPIYPECAHERLAKARIALAAMEEGNAVLRLCSLLGDMSLDEFQRTDVVWRLGERPDPRAIPFLIKAIKTDPSGAVFHFSVGALGNFKYKEAVEGLIDCFDDDFSSKGRVSKDNNSPSMFRDMIAEALRAITDMHFGSDKETWAQWWRSEGHLRNDLK